MIRDDVRRRRSKRRVVPGTSSSADLRAVVDAYAQVSAAGH